MKWLITGGCGFIGASLIDKLQKYPDHSIRVLDDLSVGSRRELESVCQYEEFSIENLNNVPVPGVVQLVVGDILDENIALQVTEGMDVVVHLAANTGVGPSVEDPRADCLSNVLGTFNYLEAARKNQVPRFIFASSGAPAGEVEPPIHEELPAHPVSPYGASKLAGEGYCSAYKRSFGLDTIALRFGNVYGPGSLHKNSVVAKFTRKALSGESLEIYGDGKQTRDFIYIEDLVDAMILASTKENVGGEVFQIATSQETTVSEMVQQLVVLLNEEGIHEVELINGEERVGDVKRNFSDTSKAKNQLGWQAKTSLDDGLRKTIRYFLNHKD